MRRRQQHRRRRLLARLQDRVWFQVFATRYRRQDDGAGRVPRLQLPQPDRLRGRGHRFEDPHHGPGQERPRCQRQAGVHRGHRQRCSHRKRSLARQVVHQRRRSEPRDHGQADPVGQRQGRLRESVQGGRNPILQHRAGLLLRKRRFGEDRRQRRPDPVHLHVRDGHQLRRNGRQGRGDAAGELHLHQRFVQRQVHRFEDGWQPLLLPRRQRQLLEGQELRRRFLPTTTPRSRGRNRSTTPGT